MIPWCPLVRHSVSSKAQYRASSCFSAVILCHRGHDCSGTPGYMLQLPIRAFHSASLSQGLLALSPRLHPKAQEVGQVIYSLDLLQGPVLLWDSLETGSLLGHITTNPKKPNKCCLSLSLSFFFLNVFIYLAVVALSCSMQELLGIFFTYSMQTLCCGMQDLVP